MTEGRRDAKELWYRASATNMVAFATMWFGPLLLILFVLKSMIRTSVALYLLVVPWALLGLIMLVRPNWISRMAHATEKVLERVGESLEKRPPGFP